MKCPKCGVGLVEIDKRGLEVDKRGLEVDKRGLEVDKRAGCGGIWLDAGELEAVAKLDRSTFARLLDVFRR